MKTPIITLAAALIVIVLTVASMLRDTVKDHVQARVNAIATATN